MAGSDGSSCKFRGSDATDATRGVLVVECVARGDGQTRTSVHCQFRDATRRCTVPRATSRYLLLYRSNDTNGVPVHVGSRYVQRSW